MKRILVTDGEHRAALAVVRSLGRSGHRVFVCSSRSACLAGASRFAETAAKVAAPLHTPEQYAADVRALCERWSIDVVVPITEESLLTLLQPRWTPPRVCIPFPSLDAFRAVSDKARIVQAAEAVGIAVPEQKHAPSRSAAAALTDSLSYPVVLKPARSVVLTEAAQAKLTVRHAATPDELRAELKRLPDAAFPLLVQRRIVGPGIGVFVLLWGGELRACFMHRRLREKPPSGGVSVYCESIPLDPELVRRVVALLGQFEWDGVAMAEMKVDRASGTPHLMEVNGRFWGSLQLAVDAGVDFPRLLMDCASGQAPLDTPSYRAGVRSRWWWGDVDHLIARMRRSPADLHLPPGSIGRAGALRQFLNWRRADRSDVFRWGDPKPMLRETIDWFARR